MKIFYTIALLMFLSTSYGNENPGEICLNIPERSVETIKIENTCKKGDIIQLNKLHIANLCDFNAAIVNYDGHDQYICVYLGKQRTLREGTNYLEHPASR